MARETIRRGATALFITASIGLAIGLLSATGDGSGLYGEVMLDDAPEPTVCVWREGYAAASTLGLWVPDYEGGDAYALVQVCVDEEALDDEDEAPLLPAEYAALPPLDLVAPVPYLTGSPDIRVWVQGHPEAPWACACAAGPACTWRERTEVYGLTFGPGSWYGEDCVPKPCNEWAGQSSWPAQCIIPSNDED